eukprot:1765882-Prymnesium_polylepis.1
MPTERRAGLGRIGIRSAKHSDCMPFVAALCVGTCGVLRFHPVYPICNGRPLSYVEHLEHLETSAGRVPLVPLVPLISATRATRQPEHAAPGCVGAIGRRH